MKTAISYFNSPIAAYVENGTQYSAQMRPSAKFDLKFIHNLITSNKALADRTERVRSAEDMKKAKSRLLPFVTPYGKFEYRASRYLVGLSGYMPVDIDHLESEEEAKQIRDTMAKDEFLGVALAYVSPSGKGVKLFINIKTEQTGIYERIDGKPLSPEEIDKITGWIQEKFHSVEYYIKHVYNIEIDKSGKDVCRACFICHDPEAKINID